MRIQLIGGFYLNSLNMLSINTPPLSCLCCRWNFHFGIGWRIKEIFVQKKNHSNASYAKLIKWIESGGENMKITVISIN